MEPLVTEPGEPANKAEPPRLSEPNRDQRRSVFRPFATVWRFTVPSQQRGERVVVLNQTRAFSGSM